MNRTYDIANKGPRIGSISPDFLIRTTIFGILMCLTSLVAIVTLFRCKKIVAQIRIVSIQLCVVNLGFGCTLIVNAIFILASRSPPTVTFKLIPYFCLLYFMFLAFTGIDRLMSLTLTTKYTFWSSKRNIYIVSGGFYTVATFLGFVPNFLPETWFGCPSKRGENLTFLGLSIFLTTMLILMLTHVVCFICIGCIVIKKALPGPLTKGNIYAKYWKITIKMVKLGFMSIVLVIPFVVTRMLELVAFCDEHDADVRFAKFVSLSLLHTHQMLSPVFILFSYHECRFVALNAILCCCEKRRRKLYDDYRQHYATYKISTIETPTLSCNGN